MLSDYNANSAATAPQQSGKALLVEFAGGGPVTDVTATAPLSSSGGATPDISFDVQAANAVLVGPESGADAAPDFRALVDADIPGKLTLQQILEPITISATAATGTINYDADTQSLLYYTSNAAANWTLNIRGDGSNTLNSRMATGQALTVVFLVTNGATPYYQSALTIDGNAITPKWQGGTAPSAGNINSVDSYSYTIIKTGSAAFTVLASQTQFK